MKILKRKRTRVQMRGNVSNEVRGMGISMRIEDSPTTNDRKHVNSTKVLERDLMSKGVITRRASETDLMGRVEMNAFYREFRPPRSRSFSLSDLVGNLTLGRMNSDSTFGSKEEQKKKKEEVSEVVTSSIKLRQRVKRERSGRRTVMV